MYTKNYTQAVQYVAELAPSLSKPGEFIKWAEDVAELLTYIYSMDYDEVTEDILENAKEIQDFEG